MFIQEIQNNKAKYAVLSERSIKNIDIYLNKLIQSESRSRGSLNEIVRLIFIFYSCSDPENFVRGCPTLTTFSFLSS